MKTIILGVCLLLCQIQDLRGQSAEMQQLMLNVEKLSQFKQILRDMEKGYRTLSSGYNTIKDISEGNFNLHQTFLDGLLQVSPTVRNYRRVGEVVNYQVVLVREYQKAYGRFRSDQNFTVDEIRYLSKVYDRLFKESLRNLDELLLVVTAGKMRMSDDDRLKEIDRIHSEMQDKLQFLRHFNNNTSILALQRQKEKKDAGSISKIYGINNH